jgi:hypothetical protein
MRNINRELPYYWGIIIPFAREHETKDASNLVYFNTLYRSFIFVKKAQHVLIQRQEYHIGF